MTTLLTRLAAPITAAAGARRDADDPADHTKTRIRVTVKGVRGPFKNFDVPAGQELVGVDLRIADAGTIPYDTPLPNGTLTLRGGETGKPTELIPLSGENPCDMPRVRLRSGQSRSVCLAFQVPKTAQAEAFQYVADSGDGDTGLRTLGS